MTTEAFNMFNFIIWFISGIITFMCQKRGIEIDYTMYWICYCCFMCNLITNII